MKTSKTLQLAAALSATSVTAKYDSAPAIGKVGFLRSVNQIQHGRVNDHDGDLMMSIWNPSCSKVCCDYYTEETCYDENYAATSCAPIADGGCPCPDGQAKCGAFEGYAGYCTVGVCCDYNTEETCYDDNYNPTSCALIADGGCTCPEGQAKCSADPDNGYPGYCTTLCCDSATEETCYDDNYNAVSCAAYTEGCPCADGQVKCGGWEGYAGYCTSACCDYSTEETCYDENYNAVSCAAYTDGGCPCADGQVKCGAYDGYAGYCTSACCDYSTEETCYDENYNAVSCAAYTDGGCPCPDGQERCGADPVNDYPGYCTELCCDSATEETCYDDNSAPSSCVALADGGCPCPEGQAKCGADLVNGYPGYCSSVCCDSCSEETCYDDSSEPISCALIADGGCPCPEGEQKCAASGLQLPRELSNHDMDDKHMSKLVEAQGTPEEVVYFRYLKMNHQKLPSVEGTTFINSEKRALERKMLAVVHTIERRESKDMQKDNVAMFVETKGTKKEIAYFHNIKKEQQRLSADEGSHAKSIMLALERKELTLLYAIEVRANLQKGNPFIKSEISLM